MYKAMTAVYSLCEAARLWKLVVEQQRSFHVVAAQLN